MNHVVPRASGHQQFFPRLSCSGRKHTLVRIGFFDYTPLIIPFFYITYSLVLILKISLRVKHLHMRDNFGRDTLKSRVYRRLLPEIIMPGLNPRLAAPS